MMIQMKLPFKCHVIFLISCVLVISLNSLIVTGKGGGTNIIITEGGGCGGWGGGCGGKGNIILSEKKGKKGKGSNIIIHGGGRSCCGWGGGWGKGHHHQKPIVVPISIPVHHSSWHSWPSHHSSHHQMDHHHSHSWPKHEPIIFDHGWETSKPWQSKSSLHSIKPIILEDSNWGEPSWKGGELGDIGHLGGLSEDWGESW